MGCLGVLARLAGGALMIAFGVATFQWMPVDAVFVLAGMGVALDALDELYNG